MTTKKFTESKQCPGCLGSGVLTPARQNKVMVSVRDRKLYRATIGRIAKARRKAEKAGS